MIGSGRCTAAEEAFAFAQGESGSFWFLNTLITVKVTSEETRGAYGLIEQLALPLHVHRQEDEQFLILAR